MKYLKSVSCLLLAGAMTMGSVFAGGNANAATSYKYQLKPGVTYKYDLDGDKDKDSIKVYLSGEKLLLKVNNKTKIVKSNFDAESMKNTTVRIYDFNKNDKSSEVVVHTDIDDYGETNILKFKDGVCKLDKLYDDAEVSSYNPSNGMVSMLECHAGRYKKFVDAIGCFFCYDRVKINGFKAYNQYTAYATKDLKNNKYVVAQTMTAYKSATSKAKAFTLKKDSKVGVYALYQKGNTRYVKVKNSDGKYGYIKAGSTLLFTKDSCLWFR